MHRQAPCASVAVVAFAFLASPVAGQTQPAATPNDGTDPAQPTKSAALSFEHRALPDGDTESSVFADFNLPLGDGYSVLAVRLPFVAIASAGNGLGVGDFGVKFSRVLPTDKSGAIILGGKLEFDTAGSTGRGTGQTVASASMIIERIVPGGTIIAPTVTHSLGLAGGDDQVNFTRINLYTVPDFGAERLYLTIDPAFTRDWAAGSNYGEIAVTVGFNIGRFLGTDAQVFMRPGAGIGAARSFDWTVEIGFQLLNF